MTCTFQRILTLVVPIVGLILILTVVRHRSRNNDNASVLSLTTTSRTKTTMCTKPCVVGDESILMQPKEYGTSSVPIQTTLRWNCDRDIADRICNNNRHYAEYSGYWERESTFMQDEKERTNTDTSSITFYDSNTGALLFTVPGTLKARTIQDFLQESHQHGWPSFRTDEVHWDSVRVLPDGETVSINGTHLGHNLPDNEGDRFCINLVCIAGNPM